MHLNSLMKKNTKSSENLVHQPSDDEIRDYAYHLYQQSGSAPGRDLENWLEAKACLEANIPPEHSHLRLHRYRHPAAFEPFAFVAIATVDAESPAKDNETPGDFVVEEMILLETPRLPQR